MIARHELLQFLQGYLPVFQRAVVVVNHGRQLFDLRLCLCPLAVALALGVGHVPLHVALQLLFPGQFLGALDEPCDDLVEQHTRRDKNAKGVGSHSGIKCRHLHLGGCHALGEQCVTRVQQEQHGAESSGNALAQ